MNNEIDNDVLDEGAAEAEKQKLDLSVEIKETSACQRHVTVSIPRTDIDRYFGAKFDELAPEAEVPGFRAGKAPRKLVESRFRPHVEDQVKGSLLMDSLAQVNDEASFSAISEPDFDFESIEIPDEGPMTYEFNIEVRPEFELPKWKGLTITRTTREISDEETDDEIRRVFSSNSDLEPVDDPVKEGDFVVVNITSRRDGRELESIDEELVEVRPTLNLADATVPNFGELMIGASAGETRTTTVTISEYADNDDLRGQEVELEFEILDVKRTEAIDVEELSDRVGLSDSGRLREIIQENLKRQEEYRRRQDVRKQISELLTESASWELPQDLLRRQMRREIERARMELQSSGFSHSDIRNQENLLRQDALRRTETMLKEHFILERIAEAEGIEETDEDFDLEIERIAQQKNDSSRRVRARLERSGQMDALRNMIIERKVIELIQSHAKFQDVVAKKKEAGKAAAATAIDFYVAGDRPGEHIPDARYDDAGDQKIPALPRERD